MTIGDGLRYPVGKGVGESLPAARAMPNRHESLQDAEYLLE